MSDPTDIGIDKDENAVLFSRDTAMDVFADGEELVFDEVSAEDGYIAFTGIDSETHVTLAFRPQKGDESA